MLKAVTMESEEKWKLVVFDTSDNTEKSFLLEAPDYEKERLVELLAEIHPEYEVIKLAQGRSVKVGNLVIRHSTSQIGVVVEEDRDYIKVFWSVDYGTLWTSKKAVEIISEA